MDYTLKLHSAQQTYTLPRGLSDLMMDITREVLRRHPRDIERFIASYLDALIQTRSIAKELTKEVDDEITQASRMKHLYKQYGITPDEAHAFATKIQAFFRGWKTRVFFRNYQNKGKQRRTPNRYLAPISDRISFKMATAAATKIQAVVRGYITRKKKLLIARNTGDAWRHDWLWTEFRMVPEDIKKIREVEAEKRKVIEDLRLVCIPKRHIEEVQVQVVEKTRKFAGVSEDESVGIVEIIGLPEEDVANIISVRDVHGKDRYISRDVDRYSHSFKSCVYWNMYVVIAIKDEYLHPSPGVQASAKEADVEAESQPEIVKEDLGLKSKAGVEEHVPPVEPEAFTPSESEVAHLEDFGVEDLGFIEEGEAEGGEELTVEKEESARQEGDEQEVADRGGDEDEFEFETITENLDTDTEVEDE